MDADIETTQRHGTAPDASAAALLAMAEELRRNGDPEAALQAARGVLARASDSPSAHAVAALALLDLGREDEARRLLERLAGGAAVPAAFDDTELDRAFEAASAEPEAMRDATDVAVDAMRAAALDGPEVGTDSPFQTRTMAALLERQGDLESARAIRASLARRRADGDVVPARGRRRERVIRGLERWLERLKAR